MEPAQSFGTGHGRAVKLHLHLGAHKTATTHVQNVMQLNRILYSENTHYVLMEEFRENVTRGAKLLKPHCNKEVEQYLNKLVRVEKENLIISEENIIGDAKDIYSSKLLYSNMEKRIRRLAGFVSSFSDTNIWFTVRSMDSFIPSLYCESLLHWDFRQFGQVFSGHYEQSWIPAILVLRDNFPNAKINVIPYEKYGTILPKWLELMTGVKVGWNLQEEERARVSINHLSVKTMNYFHLLVPTGMTPKFLKTMSWCFLKIGKGHKFSPFNESAKSKLKSLYLEDLAKIQNLGGNICLLGQ